MGKFHFAAVLPIEHSQPRVYARFYWITILPIESFLPPYTGQVLKFMFTWILPGVWLVFFIGQIWSIATMSGIIGWLSVKIDTVNFRRKFFLIVLTQYKTANEGAFYHKRKSIIIRSELLIDYNHDYYKIKVVLTGDVSLWTFSGRFFNGKKQLHVS